MDKIDLLKLIEDDDLELLNIKKSKSSSFTPDERLVASFHEINKFVTMYGREPSPGNEIHEHQLFARLKGIRDSKDKKLALLDLDEHGLLGGNVKEIKTIDDIFNDDDVGLLDNESDSIFKLKHVGKKINLPDYIASRKPCNNFDNYELKFVACQSDLATGKRKIWPFKKGQQIEKGQFFILNGILLLVADVGKREIIAGRINARLLCIFENGTESNMLLRSLAAGLYKDGRRVTEHEDRLLENFGNITSRP